MDKPIKSLSSGVRPLQAPRENINQKVREVSSLYEKHFLREMVKAMRQTVSPGGMLPDSMGQKIFRDQLDSEYVESWGKRGGIGLSDMIYDRLMQQISHQGRLPPGRPLPLDRVKAIELQSKESENSPIRRLRFKIEGAVIPSPKVDSEQESKSPSGHSAAAPVKAPLTGIVSQSLVDEEGRNQIFVNHVGGLQSRFVFHGALLGYENGATVEVGQTLGWALPESWVHWDLAQPELAKVAPYKFKG